LFKKILVGVEGSECSECLENSIEALDKAAEFAEKFGSEVIMRLRKCCSASIDFKAKRLKTRG
jgi:nucleotide-binding universal stress UspA family protein